MGEEKSRAVLGTHWSRSVAGDLGGGARDLSENGTSSIFTEERG
jgi:hypothetical protein